MPISQASPITTWGKTTEFVVARFDGLREAVVSRIARVSICGILQAFGRLSLAAWVPLSFFIHPVSAQENEDAAIPCDDPEIQTDAVLALIRLIENIQSWMLGVGLALAVLGAMYVGILLMIGGPQNVQKARRRAIYIGAGVVILLLAQPFLDAIQAAICLEGSAGA